MKQEQIAVIGAGIVGLAHAWIAAELGYDVTVFERCDRASGASIRNFGMVWPIGQPAGELHGIAMASRNRWLRLGTEAGIWVNPCGSVHLAHRPDEWAVLQEFAESSTASGDESGARLLSASEVHSLTPAANPDGLIGGFFSPTELCVNPAEAVHTMPEWLAERYGVKFQFGTHVTRVHCDDEAGTQVRLSTAHGYSVSVRRAIICCGAEMKALFPTLLQRSGLTNCKLQMLSLGPLPSAWRLGPHLASGLTLRHYRNFDKCPGMPALRQRISGETPELDQYGIHVMASQDNTGRIILGDSHEYGETIDIFSKAIIDDLILRELRKILRLPDWTVSRRWQGVYAKHPSKPVVDLTPLPNVHLVTGTGGAGMTMAFGLAEQMWSHWQTTRDGIT